MNLNHPAEFGGPRFVSRSPAAPIDGFVEKLWSLSDAPSHRFERIMPSGTIELVINLREDEFQIYDPSKPRHSRRFSGAIVSGTYGGCFVIDTRVHASIIGVHFRPGGAFPFLEMPVDELANTHVNLKAIWGTSANELRERLCAAETCQTRFDLLEKWLVRRLFRQRERHCAVRFALNAFTNGAPVINVRQAARETGFSQRHFIELFKREVGISPKLFCRIRRFQQALDLLQKVAAPNWALLAAECGYFDQSHFIHDFRAFSGLTPTDYLQQRSEQTLQSHVPLAS
jgi:AraC-like DNA-binding protein